MKNAMLKWIPIMVLLVPMQSWAAKITYDIEFTAVDGTAPTVGMFTYDGNELSDLSITWEGITFKEFTFAGALCGSGDAGIYALLKKSCPEANAVYEWYGEYGDSGYYFELLATWAPTGFASLTETWGGKESDSPDDVTTGEGTWTTRTRATAVPEPGTLALLGLGLAGLGFTRRRRQTTQV